MFVVALQGSPRIKGNTNILVNKFLKEIKELGGYYELINVANINISPCKECGSCESTGYCIIKDDIYKIFPLLKEADVILVATPIFFYGPTAQLKILIDRSQALWVRKYRHSLLDPGEKWRIGIFIGIGATKGKNLFDGSILTTRYFLDACSAKLKYIITAREIEYVGDIKKRKDIFEKIKKITNKVYQKYHSRKKILFICRENSFRSQIAHAFMKKEYGDKFWVKSAGDYPANQINPIAKKVMEEEGVDLNYIIPQHINITLKKFTPDIVISMGCDVSCPVIPNSQTIKWEIENPVNKPIEVAYRVKEEIKEKIKSIIRYISY